MIEFRHVYLKYIKDFYTLYDINLSINENSLLIGQCSDGTNSILRLISKIDKKYEGNIFFDDLNLKVLKDKDLDIAYVSEKPYLFKSKSVFENLYYPLKIRKVKQNEAKIIIDSYINKFKINFALNKIKNLTYSQQKIVTLLRALIRKPKYVLLEHYFNDLDENQISLAENIINEMKQHSTIIACEDLDTNISCFNDFRRIKLENGSLIHSDKQKNL